MTTSRVVLEKGSLRDPTDIRGLEGNSKGVALTGLSRIVDKSSHIVPRCI